MTSIEALALKGTALRIQMRAMEKAFETRFIQPVKEWLGSISDRKAVIAGIARPILVVTAARQAINESRLLEDLRTMVSTGEVTGDELKTMIMDGSLDIGSPESALAKIILKRPGTAANYMYTIPEGRAAVHWDCVRDGLEGHLRFGLDLAAAVNSLADAPVDDAFVADLQSKAAAAVRELDAARQSKRRHN